MLFGSLARGVSALARKSNQKDTHGHTAGGEIGIDNSTPAFEFAQYPPPPLLTVLSELNTTGASRNYGNARVYRYPDAPGQTKEELVQCFHDKYRICGTNHKTPCDPDLDIAPVAMVDAVRGYLPENLGELFVFADGNVEAGNADIYAVNP